MKNIIAKQALLAYPDFTKEFHIHTDASKVQLGACISQDGKPLAFYSRKLLGAHDTATERELLAIVETLKEFRNILLGQKLVIHTDHANLTYKNLTSDRVMRWHLFIEEYAPELRYIKGEKNVVSDALSRLPIHEQPQATSLEAFFIIFDSYETEKEEFMDSHPLTYTQLNKAQQKDKNILKILMKILCII